MKSVSNSFPAHTKRGIAAEHTAGLTVEFRRRARRRNVAARFIRD